MEWSIPRETLAVVGLIAGVLLFATSFSLKAVWSKVRSLLPPKSIDIEQPKAEQRSSDQLPPAGFTDHVTIILEAAPKAPAEVQLTYLIDGKTEAQTLRDEVERLGAK